jgi:23S rRNA pseudouridine1911/1915/1917 synthase
MPVRIQILGKRQAGLTLAVVLTQSMGLSHADVTHYLKNRWVRLDGELCRKAGQRVRAGQRLQIVVPRTKKPRRGPRSKSDAPPIAHAIRIRYSDEHIVVVDKPAGLTTVRHADEAKAFGDRARRFLPETLVDLLPLVSPAMPGRVRAVHRLDKETSGLVVLACTAVAERQLGKAFRAHQVERTYLALVRGEAKDERIESHFVPDRGDGRRGSSADKSGQRAVTHLRVVERLGAFTLVECRLETGRTHQVRIHLGERGTPLCGERVYDRPLHGRPLPDASGAKRPMLHAATLALSHPATGKRLAWEAEMPEDMAGLLKKRRKRACESDSLGGDSMS